MLWKPAGTFIIKEKKINFTWSTTHISKSYSGQVSLHAFPWLVSFFQLIFVTVFHMYLYLKNSLQREEKNLDHEKKKIIRNMNVVMQTEISKILNLLTRNFFHCFLERKWNFNHIFFHLIFQLALKLFLWILSAELNKILIFI